MLQKTEITAKASASDSQLKLHTGPPSRRRGAALSPLQLAEVSLQVAAPPHAEAVLTGEQQLDALELPHPDGAAVAGTAVERDLMEQQPLID